MNQGIYMCKVCGYRTNDRTQGHNCATVKAIVHKENEFVPRNGIDTLVAGCINDIKKNIGDFADKHPDELDKINPKMIIVLILTNASINLFLDGYSQTGSLDVTRAAFNDMLKEVQDMATDGLNALFAATADTKNPH